MNETLRGTMNEVRASTPPELAPLSEVLEGFVRLATEADDAHALTAIGGAIRFFTEIRDRTWAAQQKCAPEVIARFRARASATISGAVVIALASLSEAALDAQLGRLDNYVAASNVAVRQQRAITEAQDLAKREAEIVEQARRMSPDQLVREVEAGGVQLSADNEGRISIKGTMRQNDRLLIGSQRDRVVGYLRDRERAQGRTEVI